MRITTTLVLVLSIALIGLIAAPNLFAAKNMSHVHMGHVTTKWKDTPENKGFLPTAIAEANIANQHAGFAASKPTDLAWMKMHTRHILNAVDPSIEAKGPGLGYGVIKAAAGTVKHITFASESKGASKNVKAHAVHVAMSANNTLSRAREIIEIGKMVLAAKDAAKAASLVKKIHALAGQLTDGLDANGDGQVTWKKGEGGLNASAKHMGLMAKGEGLS